MDSMIIYHHRTRAHGAEGVHIRGIQNALTESGFEVCDISLVDCRAVNRVNTATPESSRKKRLFEFIANRLPNEIFKVLELLYNLYVVIAGGYRIWQMRRLGKNILFIYDRYAYFSFGVTLLSAFFSIPLVLEVNTTCLDYDVREIKFRSLAKGIEKFVFNRACLITVVSRYLEEKITRAYHVPAAKILVTPNAVNVRDFGPGEQPVDDDRTLESATAFCRNRLVIGFVGVFVPWHGLDFLLDAYKSIVDEMAGELKLGLLLVGDGPIRADIERKTGNYGLASSVHITGFVDHGLMRHYLNLFDVAVMPDSNPFGSPMKIFEYMAAAKAVAAPNYGPIAEVIVNGETGCLFTPRDLDHCIRTLKLLISDRDLRNSLGDRARSEVVRNHTWDRNLARILESLKPSFAADKQASTCV